MLLRSIGALRKPSRRSKNQVVHSSSEHLGDQRALPFSARDGGRDSPLDCGGYITVKGIPDGSSAVMPRLFCRDVAGEIEFCRSTFSAMELGLTPEPDGNHRPCSST